MGLRIAALCAFVLVAFVRGLPAVDKTEQLSIGVLAFPEWGHFLPLTSVVEVAASKGHRVTVYTVSFFVENCKRTLEPVCGNIECVVAYEQEYPIDDEKMRRVVEQPALAMMADLDDWIMNWTELATAEWLRRTRAHGVKHDVLLVDFAVDALGLIVADALKIPAMLVWPLTLAMPGQLNPRVPAIGSGLSERTTLVQHFGNMVLQRLTLTALRGKQGRVNALRTTVDVPPVGLNHAVTQRVVVTGSAFGLDFAQQTCPNIVHVGALLPAMKDTDSIPDEWLRWLDTCNASSQVVYVNMGSVGALPLAWLRVFHEALMHVGRTTCVLWKLSRHQQTSGGIESTQNVRVTHWLPFSPRLLFREGVVSVFVTHCGDTSVYEALQFSIPLVGVPLFADQPDMCARVQDAGMGVSLDKFTLSSSQLSQAIEGVVARHADFVLAADRVRATATLYGGPLRAVETLELVAAGGTPLLTCREDPWLVAYDWDVTCGLVGAGGAVAWVVRALLKRVLW